MNVFTEFCWTDRKCTVHICFKMLKDEIVPHDGYTVDEGTLR